MCLYSPKERFLSSLANFSMLSISNVLHFEPLLYPLLYFVLKRK